MSTLGLESIERTIQLTHKWINDLDARLGWDDKHRSFRLLRTVLQALRDWLSVNVAASFGAQLPELLRGIYYEHWRPVATPVKQRREVDFIALVDKAFKTDPILFTSRPSRRCLSFCLTKSRLAKSSTYAMLCPRISEHFGRFHRRPLREGPACRNDRPN